MICQRQKQRFASDHIYHAAGETVLVFKKDSKKQTSLGMTKTMKDHGDFFQEIKNNDRIIPAITMQSSGVFFTHIFILQYNIYKNKKIVTDFIIAFKRNHNKSKVVLTEFGTDMGCELLLYC